MPISPRPPTRDPSFRGYADVLCFALGLMGLCLLAGCFSPTGSLVPGPAARGWSPWFAGLTNFSSFRFNPRRTGLERVLTSPVLHTPLKWDELVVSWNGDFPPGTGLTVEARAVGAHHAGRFFILGRWAADRTQQLRESVKGQHDAEGEVQTDTLRLRVPAEALQLRLTLRKSASASSAGRIRFVGLSFLDRAATNAGKEPEPLRENWGRTLPVPSRSQLSYSGGRDWCSPTSVSMVLAYWAERLGRSELNRDVPDVAEGVYDPAWPGTGNWSFNTAFAGHFPGMRAYVIRLAGVNELERLVAAGVPPILSVSFDLLHGKAEDHGSGHLVVCAGFTVEGDFVLNDPWAKAGESVQRTVPRDQVLRAWGRSRGTAYVIHPEGWETLRGPAIYWWFCARNRSASMAAAQPMPAAVTAWR